MLLTDVADVLRAAGLNVIEMDGWQQRGQKDSDGNFQAFTPIGVLLHHDAMGLGWNDDPADDMNVPNYMDQDNVDGSQLWIRKDGAVVVMAAGLKWHAGKGSWPGVPSGNRYFIGVETDHTVGDPWPDVQVQAIYRTTVALVDHYGLRKDLCLGHKEWAPDRKIDPENFDLDKWRAYVQNPTPAPTPPQPTPPPPEDDDMAITDEDADKIADRVLDKLGITKDFVYNAYNPETGKESFVPKATLGDAIRAIATMSARTYRKVTSK